MILTQAKASPGQNKPNSRKFKKSQLDTVPQDKLHTDTPDHLEEWSKITKKISLYICHSGNVVHDLDHEVSKPVDNDVVFLGLLQKNIV